MINNDNFKRWDDNLRRVSTSEARANFHRLVDQVSDTHKPVLITGEINNAVLVSQEDWNSLQETLYLMSISGMKESIIEAANQPIEECITLEELERVLASLDNKKGK